MKGARRFLLALAGWGLLSAAARAEEIAVALWGRDGSAYELEGRFFVPVPSAAAWAVLADYDRIDEFVPSVRSSRIVRRDGGSARVEQVLSGGVFFFSRRVALTLDVREDPPTAIAFEDVSGKDFASYRGDWRVQDRPGGALVVYRLRAEPGFSVPSFIGRGAFRRGVRDLLRDVRREMLRRES